VLYPETLEYIILFFVFWFNGTFVSCIGSGRKHEPEDNADEYS